MPENTRRVRNAAKEQKESQLKRTCTGREARNSREMYTRDTVICDKDLGITFSSSNEPLLMV